MYPVASNFHTLAIQDAPQTRIRIYFIGDAVDCTDDNDVQSNGTLLVGAAGDTDSNGRIGQNGVVFNELFNPDKNIQIGRAVSSQIGMTLLNTDGALDNFSYGRCKVYLDVYDSANSAWLPCPMGVYIIELPTKRKVQLVNAVGFDQMTKLDAICDTWWNGLNWSGGLTLLQIVNSMAAQLGVSVSSNTASAIVNSSLTFTAAPFDCVEVTYREVLEVIAEATGTVARFDRDGALDLRWINTPTISGNQVTINTDTVGNQCLALDVAEYTVEKIDLLRAKFAEGDIGVTVGSGTNEYVITNNLFLNGANTAAITNKLTPIYNRLYGIAQYTPISGRFIFDWSVEAGDIINIVNDSITYAVPIFQQTMTWRGGYVVSDLICDGDKTRPVLDSAERDYYRLDSDMRTLVIEAPRINLLGYTTINDGFKINLDGTFEANGATINGSLESKSGVGDTGVWVGGGNVYVIDSDGNILGEFSAADDVGRIMISDADGINGNYSELANEEIYFTDNNNVNRAIVGNGNNNPYFVAKDANGNVLFSVIDSHTYVNNALSTTNSTGKIEADGGVGISGTLDVGTNATIGGALDVTGSITVGNVLYIPNRRASASSIASAGWYRVLEFSPNTAAYRLGRAGIIIDLDITRFGQTNETHKVSLSLIETNARFIGENSNSNTQLIDKVRYTYDGSKGYVDIHLSSSYSANVAVDYQVSASAASFFAQVKTLSLASVADSPSGETVLTEYTFSSNTDIATTTFTPSSGSSYSTYSGCFYERKNGLTHVHIGVSGLTANTTTTVYTLPSDVRPSTRIASAGLGGTLPLTAAGQIQTSGVVQINSTGTYAMLDFWYF